MEEISSRFVDRIAVSRLVDEKLSRVHHAPGRDGQALTEPLFGDFRTLAPRAELVQTGSRSFVFDSPVHTIYPENNTCPVLVQPAGQPAAGIVFIHGLYEDNRDIHSFLLKDLNKAGYNLYLVTLPFHYERTPARSSFSGEYFFSADIMQSRQAFRQAVYELYQLYNTIRLREQHPVFIAAFSMGGGVALALASLYAAVGGMYVINPICSLSRVVWDSPLCRTIKDDLLANGFSLERILELYAVFEPVSVNSIAADCKRIGLGYGLYDQITSVDQYLALAQKWQLSNITEYHAGHLNILRVPRLAADIHRFFSSV